MMDRKVQTEKLISNAGSLLNNLILLSLNTCHFHAKKGSEYLKESSEDLVFTY